MGKLSKGESVLSESGHLVHPQDCMSPSKPGGITLILDCPSSDLIPKLQTHECLAHYQASKQVTSIVHLTNLGVLLHPEYVTWSLAFGREVLHQFVLSRDDHIPLQYVASNHLQAKLRCAWDEKIFPILFETSAANIASNQRFEDATVQSITSLYGKGTKFSVANVLSSLQFHPPKKLQLSNGEQFKVIASSHTPVGY